MFELIKRHFQSVGFQRRLKNIYIPALKVALAYVWNKIRDNYEGRIKKSYAGEYAPDFDGDTRALEVATASGVEDAPKAQANELAYEDAVELIKRYAFAFTPQVFGKCVAHTYVNAHRFIFNAIYGQDQRLSEDDVYIDRATKGAGLDAGMYPDKVIKRLAEKGIAPYGFVPEATTIQQLQENTRENYPDETLNPVRTKIIKDQTIYWAYNNFEIVWSVITSTFATKGVRVFQASIRSYSGWWNGGDLPTATGSINGAHSVLGFTIPFRFNGERAFFVFDSAYATWRVWRIHKGVRIVRESCWKGLGNSIRMITWKKAIEDLLAGRKPEDVKVALDFDVDALVPVKSARVGGKRSEAVRTAQKALIYVLKRTPAGAPSTYYGNGTRGLVIEFHGKYSDRFKEHGWSFDGGNGAYNSLKGLDGDYIGSVTIEILKEVVAEIHT